MSRCSPSRVRPTGRLRSRSSRAPPTRPPTSSSRPTSPSATTAAASCSTPPTGASATRSPTAPTAVRGSRSSRDCPTTASARRCAAFELCPDCRREYEDPRDRRFHAEPNACPVCGPRLTVVRARRGAATVRRRPATRPRRDRGRGRRAALRAGEIVAIKGLGGFHLACDATSDAAVRELKARKGRPHKPLAVMFGDLEQARRHCVVDDDEARLLESVEHPIVLVEWRRAEAVTERRREDRSRPRGRRAPALPRRDAALHAAARAAAARGRPAAGDDQRQPGRGADRQGLGRGRAAARHPRPVPAARPRDRGPLRRLGGAGAARAAAAAAALAGLRTVPGASAASAAPGAGLRRRAQEHLLPHARRQRLPQPAHRRPREPRDARALREQHRPLPSGCSASSPRSSPTTCTPSTWRRSTPWRCPTSADGAAGREASACSITTRTSPPAWSRTAASSRSSASASTGSATATTADCGAARCSSATCSATAARRISSTCRWRAGSWRSAARRARPPGWLLALLGGDGLERARRLGLVISDDEAAAVARQVETGVNAPLTSSCGRLFDAVAALAGVRSEVTYEAQAAIELEMVSRAGAEPYPWEVDDGDVSGGTRRRWARTTQPAGRAAGAAVRGRARRPRAAARRRPTSAVACTPPSRRWSSTSAGACATAEGLGVVALSGGVFQNRLLDRARARHALEAAGFRVLTHALVPANDGGLSLGQAVVAGYTVLQAARPPRLTVERAALAARDVPARDAEKPGPIDMCLAIPMRITAVDGAMATIEADGLVQKASLALVPEARARRLRARPRRLRDHRDGRRRGRGAPRAVRRMGRVRAWAAEQLSASTAWSASLTAAVAAAGRARARRCAAGAGGLTFMEVCGTHTMAISRYGLRDLLPAGIRLVSGPGCPVCVTAMRDLDLVVELARLPEVTIVTFGDLVRVPSSRTSLAEERAAGADVRVVYSPADAVELAADDARPPGRLRRHRLRDHGADGRRLGARGPGARRRQLLGPLPAQDHAGAAAGAARARARPG